MDNQRSNGQQFFIFLLLSLTAAWMLFGQNKQAGQQRPSKAPYSLHDAFIGLDPTQGPLLTPQQAQAEIDARQGEITKNDQDGYSYWARLRIALVQQYIFKKVESKPRPPSLISMLFHQTSEWTLYDQVVEHGVYSKLVAQAAIQESDWSWKQDQAKGKPSQKAAAMLEQLFTRARNAPGILEHKIWVPRNAEAPADAGPPAGGFRETTLTEIRVPLLERVDSYYRTTILYKLLDFGVNLFGGNPKFSYGLALIVFGLITRVLMQPLNKKQYESMKGMQIIAPEMKKIQDKYKGKTDQQAQMQMMKEIRLVQQQHGVSPFLGCLLMFIQIPFFFVVVSPMIQHYEAKMELVHASFLWVHSLAGPDIALLIAYGISMYFSMRLSTTPPTDDMQRQQMIMMSVIFPVMMPFVLHGWPSAFVLYWMTFNFLSMVFQWHMMKSGDPNKSVVKTLFASPFAPVVASAGAPAKGTPPVKGTPSVKSAASAKAAPGAAARTDNGATVQKTAERAGAIPPRPRRDAAGVNGSAKAAANGTALRDTADEEVFEAEEAFEPDGQGLEPATDNRRSPQPQGPRRNSGNSQRARRRRRY